MYPLNEYTITLVGRWWMAVRTTCTLLMRVLGYLLVPEPNRKRAKYRKIMRRAKMEFPHETAFLYRILCIGDGCNDAPCDWLQYVL
jgi:hypothetical protein